MADRADTTSWCPRCMRPTGEAARCPSCGLAQLGADADRLRVVVWRLHEIGERQRALEEEAAPLRLEQVRLLQVLGDWYALRRAGVAAGWSPAAWWALGSAVAAAIAGVAARWLRVQRLSAAVLVQASAVLVVTAVAESPWTSGGGLALLLAAPV